MASHRAQECLGRVGKRGLPAMHQPQHALHLQLVHRHAHQLARLQLAGHGEVRHQRHAVAHGHKALDGLDGGQLDGHIERRAVALEGLNHLAAQRRSHVVGDEKLLPRSLMETRGARASG